MILTFKWEDREWDYDPALIDVATSRKIREITGGRGMKTWQRGIDEGDPDCLVALLYAIQRQSGVQQPTWKTWNFSVLAFQEEMERAVTVAVTRDLLLDYIDSHPDLALDSLRGPLAAAGTIEEIFAAVDGQILVAEAAEETAPKGDGYEPTTGETTPMSGNSPTATAGGS